MDEFNKDPNNNNNNNKMKNSFKNFVAKATDKDGFYIILFICICIVATTGVWVSKNNIEKINSINNYEDLNIVEDPDLEEDLLDEDVSETTNQGSSGVTIVEIDQKPNAEDTKEEEAKPVGEQKTKAIPTSTTNTAASQQLILKAMVVPTQGNIITEFARDKLIYDKTLQHWTTHDGIDIGAREGVVVRAALDGIISQIESDPGMGITIVVDHGQGVQTKYAQLSTREMVTVGQEVKKGDPISGVGKGVGFKMANGPHLHFQVIVDGEPVDPIKYLPTFNQ